MDGPKSKIEDVRVSGPLALFAGGFRVALLGAGFTPLSTVVQLRLMAHLSRWMDAAGLAAADLTADRTEEFLAARRAAGYRGLRTRRALAPLLGHLGAQDVLPPEEPLPPVTRAAALLAEFERYLLAERGLAAMTTEAYVRRARWFLESCAPDGDLSGITPADVTGAVLAECASKSVGAGQYYVASLRALLRFGHVQGLIGEDLSAAALSATGRRSSRLPNGITEDEGRRLLAACDRRRPVGLRDYAVLVTLLRLGLRAGEVAALRLEDLDWRAGEMVIRGKGRREDQLPLPADVGEAIAAYLQRGRPAAASRAVFLTVTAPTRPLTRRSVGCLVRHASVRAGMIPIGPHRLRHTTACVMVAAKVPLSEIGQVLRHHSPGSTSNYARVDVDQLRALARPWPAADGEQR
ncbi:site-specific integrase [Nonomuraea typhae]|uniref:Site-specific integrase n=1 Tax=Nonomuraea typhae TaxID=2603600 RepID=A0ABW7YPQ0_9ACTN